MAISMRTISRLTVALMTKFLSSQNVVVRLEIKLLFVKMKTVKSFFLFEPKYLKCK